MSAVLLTRRRAKRVRELMATDTALNPELWSAVAEQGWLGLHLSEACGGLGLSPVELAVVAEEMGREIGRAHV